MQKNCGLQPPFCEQSFAFIPFWDHSLYTINTRYSAYCGYKVTFGCLLPHTTACDPNTRDTTNQNVTCQSCTVTKLSLVQVGFILSLTKAVNAIYYGYYCYERENRLSPIDFSNTIICVSQHDMENETLRAPNFALTALIPTNQLDRLRSVNLSANYCN